MQFDCETLKTGDACETRDGCDAHYVGTMPGGYGDRFVFFCNGELMRVFQHGRWYSGCRKVEKDVVRKKPERRKLEGWICIWQHGGTTGLYTCKETLLKAIANMGDGCIAVVPVCQEYELGQGLDNPARVEIAGKPAFPQKEESE